MAGFARVVAAALIALVAAMAAAPGALAHAVLLRADPADGAALAVSPPAVTLGFNEAVTVIAARVLDARGLDVARYDGGARDDAAIVIALPPDLPAGVYIATWRVISADSHPVAGSLVFAVGSAVARPATAQVDAGERSRDALWQSAAIAMRALRDAALLFACGGALFAALVLARPPRLARRIRSVACVAIAAAAIGVGIVGALASAAPAGALFGAAPWRIGLQTTAAHAAATMIAGLAVIIVAMPAATAMRRVLAIAGAIVATAAPALTGHARMAPDATAPTLQALHNLAAAFWVGAFWPLLALARDGDDAATARAARRFSALAVPAVAVLIVAGVASALAHADSVAGLLASGYGALVSLKLAIVVLLLIVAAANRFRLVPALAAGGRNAARRFAGALRLDLALAGLVVIVTAALVHTPPPHGGGHDHPHEQAGAEPSIDGAQPFTVATASGAHSLVLTVADRRVGATAITLEFAGADGAPFVPRAVSVEFALPDAGIAPIARSATAIAPGRHQVGAAIFPLPGRWQVRVDALVSDFEKAVFETSVEIR